MNIFFDINKIIYKYEKDGTLKKIENKEECVDGICLITNINTNIDKKYIYTNVFDYKTKIDIIRREIKNEINDYVYVNHLENQNNFVFALSKEYFLNLIDNYGFKKVYPLEFFLYKIGFGRNGIVSDQIMFLKKYENEMDFKSNYLNFNNDETFYYINLSIDIYIQNLKRMSDDSSNINIAIFSNEINDSITTFNKLDINSFIKLIKLYEDFYIQDKISNRYKKLVLNRYLYLIDFFVVSLIVVIGMFYLKNETEIIYYNSESESQNIQISNFDKLNKDILAQLPKMEFTSFPLEEAKDLLTPFTNYEPTKVVYTFNTPKKEILITMVVSGIDNVENFLKFLKEKKYENSYTKKEGYNFEFKIKIKQPK